jgi:hypothetical protein
MVGGDERSAGARYVFAGRRRCFSKGDTKTASARRAVTRLEGLVTARRTGAGAGAGAGAVPRACVRACVRACERRDGGRLAWLGLAAWALDQQAGVWW